MMFRIGGRADEGIEESPSDARRKDWLDEYYELEKEKGDDDDEEEEKEEEEGYNE